jgi:glycosyltransferase involved in cell wall biosynthesis
LKTSRPNVLFISHSPHFGGAERCLYYLLRGLSREKFDLSVVLPPKPLIHRLRQRNTRKLIEELRIPVHMSPIRWWIGRWPRYRAFADGLAGRVARLVHLMQKERFDLAVSNTSAFVEGALAARYCGIPHLWYVHEMLADDPALRSFMPLERLYGTMDSLSAGIITVSHAVARQFEPHVRQAKLQVVHTGLPEIRPIAMDQPKKVMFDLPTNVPVVTFVGLLSQRKGVLDFVESATHVLKRFPKTVFVLAGSEGGQGREAFARIDECRMRDSFRILGNRNDIPSILSASDMLVMPSLADPLPLAVLEAMAAGIPVVATRSGGCEEMVEDGVTGRLVPVKNPVALAETIGELIESPSKRVLMGLGASRRFAEHFNYTQYISRFEEILRRTCEGPRQGFGHEADAAFVDDLVAKLAGSASEQARLMSNQAAGLSRLASNLEASIRCWSLL